MQEGERYLFLSYSQFHVSGVLRRIFESGPGVVMIEVEQAVAIGETGDIGAAQLTERYEPNQSGPLHGRCFIPWHDVAKVLPQGALAKIDAAPGK